MPLTQTDIDEISQMIHGSPTGDDQMGAPTDIDTGYWSVDNWEWPYAPETLNPWLNDTPEGRDFKSKIDSGGWKVGEGKEILSDMMKGHSYDKAVSLRGWGGFIPRFFEDVKQAGPEVWELIKDPVQIWTDFWDVLGQAKSGDPDEQNLYEGTKTRAFQALEEMAGDEVTRVAIVPWVIAEGMVIGMAHAVWNVARGEAGAGDVLDIVNASSPCCQSGNGSTIHEKCRKGCRKVDRVRQERFR